MGYSALTARDLATMQRNAGSQKRVKPTLITNEKMMMANNMNKVFPLQADQRLPNFGLAAPDVNEIDDRKWKHHLQYMAMIHESHLKKSILAVQHHWNRQLQPEWSRFVTVVKQSKEIDTISYHTLFDILKQYQNEVNDIRAERIAKSENPLALLAAAQPYSDN
ncbi:hypothetical protein Tco_0250486 [Tanacetum coccineum]